MEHSIIRRMILRHELTEKQADFYRNIDKELDGLETSVAHLGYSVSLVCQAEVARGNVPDDDDNFWPKIKQFGHWKLLGARGAIGAINTYGDALEHLKDLMVGADFGAAIAREAWAEFQRLFPHWKSARHASVHSHEIQREADKNYVVGKMNNGLVSKSYGSQVLLMDSFRGDTFVTTRRGQTL